MLFFHFFKKKISNFALYNLFFFSYENGQLKELKIIKHSVSFSGQEPPDEIEFSQFECRRFTVL